MFQLKQNSSDSNPSDLESNVALPNSHGKVRTLKEDFDNWKAKGKNPTLEEPVGANQQAFPSSAASGQPIAPPSAPLPPASESVPAQPSYAQAVTPFEKVMNSPAQSSAQQNPMQQMQDQPVPGPAAKQADAIAPNPFGTDNFFNEQQPTFENVGDTLSQQEKKQTASGRGKKIGLILAIVLLLAAIAGGAYYWFVAAPSKPSKPAQTAPSTSTAQTKPATTAPQTTQPKTNGNVNLRQWRLDASADQATNISSLKKNIDEFLNTAADNDLVEIKLSSSDNQPISAQKLGSLLGISFPSSISASLADGYSFFARKENSEARLGAVMKFTESPGVLDSLKNEEGSMLGGFKFFYLDSVPAETATAFSAGQYKNADIRYFNFSSLNDLSIDYSVITGKDSSYFVLATSKDSMHSILDYILAK